MIYIHIFYKSFASYLCAWPFGLWLKKRHLSLLVPKALAALAGQALPKALAALAGQALPKTLTSFAGPAFLIDAR